MSPSPTATFLVRAGGGGWSRRLRRASGAVAAVCRAGFQGVSAISETSASARSQWSTSGWRGLSPDRDALGGHQARDCALVDDQRVGERHLEEAEEAELAPARRAESLERHLMRGGQL